AGFLSGGKLALAIAAAFVANASDFYWVTFIIGGVIGAILLLMLFDWALIFLSSIVGAYLMLAAVKLPATGSTVLLMVLVVVAVLVQVGALRRGRAAVVE